MKMKEFGPPGGARVPSAPPWIRQWSSIRQLCSGQHEPHVLNTFLESVSSAVFVAIEYIKFSDYFLVDYYQI